MSIVTSKNKRNRYFFSIMLPIVITIVWLVAAGIGGPYFGRIEEVSSNDPATFLPESAEATKVNDRSKAFYDSSSVPAIVVFESDSELSEAQLDQIEAVCEEIESSPLASEAVSPLLQSENNKAAYIVVPIDSEAEFGEVVPELQALVQEADLDVRHTFSGPALFSRDLQDAFAGIDGTLLVVALSVVFVILLVVYRSPVLPIITLLGAVAALSAAILLVFYLAKADIVMLNGQVQGILFILVIGAATDYSLLYIARYREELKRHKNKLDATIATWKASIEPILAAGGTVILGLLCLLASDLGSNQALGPVGSIGLVFAMLVALTYLPAVLLLFGRTAFWPRRPEYAPKKKNDYIAAHPTWAKIAGFVSRHPRRIWMTIVVLLLVACVFIPQLRADGVSQENLILGESDAREGQKMLNKHFADGAGSPTQVIVPQDQETEVVQLLEEDQAVETISVVGANKDMPSIPLGAQAEEVRSTIRAEITQEIITQEDRIRSSLEAETDPFKDVERKIADGDIMLEVTLKDPASSVQARETIQRLRDTVRPLHPDVLFGGVSAIQLDTNASSDRDIVVVMPMILVAITIVLMLLLRSIVAPIIVVLTTVISFGATIGIAALLFNHVWDFPGADPAVIIYGFVFLVALGIDYNIFLMTRVREETVKLGVREGTLKALVVTGGVITSAGIVLAATFAALNVIPILFLTQIAFIVAFGVLLDTLIVRSLLVPALTLELGRPMWWPSKIAKQGNR